MPKKEFQFHSLRRCILQLQLKLLLLLLATRSSKHATPTARLLCTTLNQRSIRKSCQHKCILIGVNKPWIWARGAEGRRRRRSKRRESRLRRKREKRGGQLGRQIICYHSSLPLPFRLLCNNFLICQQKKVKNSRNVSLMTLDVELK